MVKARIVDKCLDPETLESPFEFFDEIREAGPVYYSESLKAYVITRYEECRHVMGHPAIFSSVPVDSPDLMVAIFATEYHRQYQDEGVPPAIPTLVSSDGDVHRRYRDAVDRTFDANAVRALEPRVQELANRLIDDFVHDGQVDLYEQFCKKLPLLVICEMLGLSMNDIPLLQRSADALVRLAGAKLETPESRIALHGDQIAFFRFVLPRLEELKASPDDSLMSKLLHTPTNDGTYLSTAELLSIIMVLNTGGNETTTNGLGSMFWRCFRDPDLQARLRADRSLIDRFVEEVLRLETPVAAMARWVTADTEIGGVAIPKGAVVQANLSAANRDPRKFHCPADVDVARKGIRNHLGFGMGAHYCLGAFLSRSELRVSMNLILDRLSAIELAVPDAALRHHQRVIVRGVTSLPIVFKPAAGLEGQP